MNLHSDYPFWLVKEGLLADYPRLNADATADVVVIGGGVSGALIADALERRGVDTIVVERRHVGFGSTSASTALLQYEIDNPLFELVDDVGEAHAVRAYELCGEAIGALEKVCARLPGKAEFRRRPSLWFASTKKDARDILEPELAARRAAGFEARMLDEREMVRKFGFSAPAAILSELGATCHPYKLTASLLASFVKRGGRVHDLTEIAGWKEGRSGVELVTVTGLRLRARHVIVAAGYESQAYLDRLVTRFHSTYAIVSKPEAPHPWHRDAMIWETKSPYLYMRPLSDGRIVTGGRDVTFQSPHKRDALIARKSRELRTDFAKLFPHLPFEIDFAWAGTFGETKDGLPYIGAARGKRVHFAMGYGGNGITFSVIAARLLADAVTGRKNPDAKIFAFDR